jgi:murein DD-endopeptidase MepM/ murein hydrolase activator NlpD
MPYTIQRGDTLSGLAKQHSTSVDELMRLNPTIKDPNKIFVGASLNLPGTQTGTQAPTQDYTDILKKLRDTVTGLKERVDLINQPNLKMPDATSDISAAQKVQDQVPSNWLAEQQVRLQKEAEESKAQRDTAMEERKGLTDQLKDFFTGRQGAEDKTRSAMGEFGVNDINAKMSLQIDQIMATQTHLNDLVAQRDGALGALGQQAIATPFLTGQQARVAQAYDSRINSLSAKMGAETAYLQAQQGQLQNAMAMVGTIVDAYTYDTKMELDKYSMFLDLNAEEIGMLDTEYQNALQGQQRYWEMRYEEERQERETVINLMLEYTQAGISHTDSVQDAVSKASEWLGIQPDADVKELMAQYPGAGIAESDTFTEAINKISKIPVAPEQPKIFGGETGGYYEQYYNPETNKWETRQVKSGIGWKPTAPTTAEIKVGELAQITQILTGSVDKNGYTDTDKYLSARINSTISASDFDNRFGHLLDPVDKERLGITDVKFSKTEKEATVWQWLATDEAKALSDEELSLEIKRYGLNPETFNIY